MPTHNRSTQTGVTGLHHVGLVVSDIGAARAAYTRLGFVVPPATFPALPPGPGQQPQAFGAGNTHITFASTFLELATVVDDTSNGPAADRIRPEDQRLHVIHAPDAALERLTTVIAETTARLRSALDRFEGLHILALQTTDADAVATRMRAAGVPTSGVQRLQRPIETADGTRIEPIGYLELDEPSLTPEGRLAVAENPPTDVLAVQVVPDHPNGATALTEVHLSAPDADLDLIIDRYHRYLDLAARADGPSWAFELEQARVVVTPVSRLPEVLPGAAARTDGPAIAGCTLTVRDLAATAEHFSSRDVSYSEHNGRIVVTGAEAAGATLVFSPAEG